MGCLIVISWMAWQNYRPANDAEIARLMQVTGGPEVVECLRSSSRAWLTRLVVRRGIEHPVDRSHYEPAEEPLPVPDELRAELGSLLSSARSLADPPQCQPRYDYLLSVTGLAEPVEVWISVECRQLLFVAKGKVQGIAGYPKIRAQVDRILSRITADQL